MALLVLLGCAASPTAPTPSNTGDLRLLVNGLPEIAAPVFSVTGPDGFHRDVGRSATLEAIPAGDYTVAAGNGVADGFTFTPAPLVQTVTVSAGTSAPASFFYAATDGKLTVLLEALPSPGNVSISVTGPNGYSRTIASSQTINGLAPGSYLVTAGDAVGGNGLLVATPAVQTITVVAGSERTATVTFSEPPPPIFANLTAGYHARSMLVNGVILNYQLFIPQGYDPSQQYPVILFAHGSGETGADNQRQLTVGLGPTVTAQSATFPAVVIFPQQPPYGPVPYGDLAGWFSVANTIYLTALDSTLRQVHSDPSRLYMTGVSLGAFRTWGLAYAHPTLFAAIAPVAGGMWKQEFGVATEAAAAAIAVPVLRDLPIWQWQGDADTQVPLGQYIFPIRDAFAALGNPSTYHLVIAPGRGHELEVNYQDPAFWAWLFGQHR